MRPTIWFCVCGHDEQDHSPIRDWLDDNAVEYWPCDVAGCTCDNFFNEERPPPGESLEATVME